MRYRGFLLDLDGTIYRGNEPIPEAAWFLERLREHQLPYLYVTNNSSATPETVASRLTGMGIPARPEEVYTSSMAVIAYLQQYLAAVRDVFAIGEEGLFAELQRHGYRLTEERPACVVVGIDREFSYRKLAAAAKAIREGAVFLATNNDAALPTETGLVPGNGSLVAAVSVASGAAPVVVGKPQPLIIEYALKRLGLAKEEALIVGDNLNTDILAGHYSGVDSLLVLTGFSQKEDAARSEAKPTEIAPTLRQWWETAANLD